MSYQILIGDCLDTLKTLPEQSVHTCVTSPPYFGLRDYNVEGQLGAEPTPDEFVAALVRVFREVRRVLRDDGTAWLNLGDSYGSKRGLHGIPWRVALALQDDGWHLRQDIIWHKPNPMPESIKNRCTKAHEYIFLLSKSRRYYYDVDSVREPYETADRKGPRRSYKPGSASSHRISEGHEEIKGPQAGLPLHEKGRNRRSVWKVTAKPYRGAHFATFPPDLILPCILAGCPEGGTVLDPFGGTGTTAGVAMSHGRNAVLCEISPDYGALVPDRVQWVMDYYGVYRETSQGALL